MLRAGLDCRLLARLLKLQPQVLPREAWLPCRAGWRRQLRRSSLPGWLPVAAWLQLAV